MKNSYPIILMPNKVGYIVYVPDFDINTEGDTLTDAIEMARDAIGVVGIDMEDDGESLPEPTAISAVKTDSAADIVTLVDVDFEEYRRKNNATSREGRVSRNKFIQFIIGLRICHIPRGACE